MCIVAFFCLQSLWGSVFIQCAIVKKKILRLLFFNPSFLISFFSRIFKINIKLLSQYYTKVFKLKLFELWRANVACSWIWVWSSVGSCICHCLWKRVGLVMIVTNRPASIVYLVGVLWIFFHSKRLCRAVAYKNPPGWH